MLSKSLQRKALKKYFYSTKVLDDWNKLIEGMINMDSVHKFQNLLIAGNVNETQ